MPRTLLVSTGEKDQSDALEGHLRDAHPHSEFRSAGVDKYLCLRDGTRCLTDADIDWCDLIVYAETIHRDITYMKFEKTKLFALERLKRSIVLDCGQYARGRAGEDWLTRAEDRLKTHLV